MSFLTQKSKPLLLAAAALSMAMAASCDLPASDGTINFEMTGQVLDFDTKQPIEGAYVLAVYEKVDLGFAASARYCVKTKGMTTSADGKFHFPVEKLDGLSPQNVYAIKPDYFYRDFASLPPGLWKKQNKEAYSNHHIYLKKQDAAKASFQFGFGECSRPESAQAAEANIQFLTVMKSEYVRLGGSENGINILNDRMKRLQSAPDKK
jgi:hypothetical protein